MELNGTSIWVIAMCFGAFMVGIYSWSRFDEPSYDSQSEYFARYKPRFSTSHARYARAKWAYLVAIILIYGGFTLVPELFSTLAVIQVSADNSKGSFPLAVAFAIITLQNVPGLKDLERRVRGMLHSVARIPECVRRTVAQMRTSPFNFKPNGKASQTRKLGATAQPEVLDRLILEDDVLHGWYSIGCLLCSLSENNRARTGIDLLFFDYYKDELDSIAAKHVALAQLVREHLAECLRPNSSAGGDSNDSAIFREIRDLRDRLYTFVACGVHSSVASDAESLEIIKKLGFAITPTDVGHRSIVGPLAGLSFIALLMLSIFTGYSADLFNRYVLAPLPPERFGLPKETLGLYAWTGSTAVFYFMAMLGALVLRNSRVARRQWFDLDNLDRERPILRYITPTLVGTALGCMTLLVIASIGGPAFKAASVTEVGYALLLALGQTAPWFPLATVIAVIAVTLSDSRLSEGGFWRGALRRSLYGAAVMALVGFLTSQLNYSTGIFAAGEVPEEVRRAGDYVSLYIAGQIALLVGVLCVIVQVAELYTDRSRSFAGKYIDAVTRQGPIFGVFFDPSGKATLFDAREGNSGSAPVLCRGRWQQFPEGTAVKWDTEAGADHCKAGDFGLLSSYGDSLIYEG